MEFRTPEQTAEELKQYFDQQERFEFERALGHGAYGITSKVLDKKTNPPRRLAVKRALGSDTERELQNEIRYLKSHRGAAHIVQLLASRSRSSDTSAPRRFIDRLLRRGRWLNPLPGPTMVMEYLEHGDLQTMIFKASFLKMRIPNRMLWSIYLCLVRACVAMAYPPRGGHGAPIHLENVPTGNRPPSRTAHRDIRPANIVAGAIDPSIAEHSVVPIVKIIDFGIAIEDWGADPGSAVKQNLLDATKVMICLITHLFIDLPPAHRFDVYEGMRTLATTILDTADYPDLDEDLRRLIARSCARDRLLRPDLLEMLQITEQAVLAKSPESYGRNEDAETDDAIKNILQKLTQDAIDEPLLEAENEDGSDAVGNSTVNSWDRGPILNWL